MRLGKVSSGFVFASYRCVDARLSYQPAGAPFAGPVRLPYMRDRRSPVLRAYHFFSTTSFNIVMSNA